MDSVTPSKMRPALIGGVALGATLSALAFVANLNPALGCLQCSCCVLGIGGGFLAVFLYLKELGPTPEKPYADGAVLGLMSGVVAAVVSTVLSIPVQLALQAMGLAPDVEEIMQQFEQADLPPEFIQVMEMLMPAEGISFLSILLGLGIGLVVYAILGVIGGIIGVAVLHKEQPLDGSPGGYTAPPPPAPTA